MQMKETDKKIVEYASRTRVRRSASEYPNLPPDYIYKEPITNFVELNPITKINILDTIIKKSKSVFGPYGGLYGEIEADTMIGQNRVKEGEYIKSKDGYNFFKVLSFNSKYAQTILSSVQQLTKYISGYEGETSRDGTTSLSIVGCNVARELLTARLDKPQIPSTIHNIVFDTFRGVGTSAVEKYAYNVYNPNTASYTENGREMILNAINTTVDGNPVYKLAFGELMEKCSTNKYDILNAVFGTPNFKSGEPRITIDFKAGIKFRGECLDKSVAGGFKDRLCPTFVLDGLIKAPNRDVFVYQFKNWIKLFLSSYTMENGKSAFGSSGNMTPPLFIITHIPDYLKEIYLKLMLEGVNIIYRDGSSEVIRPHFMFANQTEMFEVFFNDIRTVFHEMFIDLGLINKYIDARKTTKAEMGASGVRKHALPTEVDISSLFPMPNSEDTLMVNIPYTEVEEDTGLPDTIEQEAKYDKTRKCEFAFTKVMFESNWDGQAISVAPIDNECLTRAKEHREKIQALADSYADTALEANELQQRLEFFSGVTLKPTIYHRGEDERKQMYDLYEDALGVFASVHKYGVMPGSNIFFLKASDIIAQEVNELLDKYFESKNVSESRKAVYREYISDVAQSLVRGYERSLEILSPDDADMIINNLNHSVDSDHILESYDIVSGQWTTNVIEAARTTSEVFSGALSIAKDMMELKNIRVLGTGAEYNDAMDSNKECYLLPEYKEKLENTK